jgi:prophage regulatory protein
MQGDCRFSIPIQHTNTIPVFVGCEWKETAMNAQTQAPALHLAHTAKPVTPRDRLIRLPQVEAITGFKKSTLYGWIKEGTFPRPIQIHQWVQDRIQEAQQ